VSVKAQFSKLIVKLKVIYKRQLCFRISIHRRVLSDASFRYVFLNMLAYFAVMRYSSIFAKQCVINCP